jgi:carboxymethylenebutenolidase
MAGRLRYGASRNGIHKRGTKMAEIQIKATDGTGSFAAWLVEPARKPAGAVVLIQEIFGVNDSMKETAAQVADLGFFVLVPDIFWRQKPGVNLTDKTQEEWQQAFALMQGFDPEKGIEDLKATLAAARRLPGANGKAGTMGYCLGGRLAFLMAERSDADVNVSYYGVGLDDLIADLPKVTRPLLVHVADKDEYFPAEGRAKLLAAVKGRANIHAWTYDADHAFARVNGIHWHGRSAVIANGRSAEALAAALD